MHLISPFTRSNHTRRLQSSFYTLTVTAALASVMLAGLAVALAGEPVAVQKPDLGVNADLHGKRPFLADSPWNQDVSKLPVDARSKAIIARIGMDKPLHPDFGVGLNGIPYQVVAGTQAKLKIDFTTDGSESDPGPYPVPADAVIEGGAGGDGDRHVLVVDRDNWVLYELFSAFPAADGGLKSWKASSGAVWDLKSNSTRPAGWTSADAAGLPIFPGLVRYDEAVVHGVIDHALRFTASKTRRAYVAPASHFASRETAEDLPPMGMRVRLRADFEVAGFPRSVRPILTALKKYGMILADNGSDWFISGAPDPKWSDDELHVLTRVKGKDFEVIEFVVR